MYSNLVILIGNITRQPELKALTNGNKVTNLTVAVNKTWTDRESGEKKEATEFISVSVFGKQAENCAQYLEKGQKVMVEGHIKNRVEEKDGSKTYHTGVVADRVQFGQKAGGSSQNGNNTGYKSKNTSESAIDTNSKAYDALDPIDYPEENINPEDIPF